MQRLTLILSDLYLPQEAASDTVVRAAHALPHLSWLLRYAARAPLLDDWRTWLVREIGIPELALVPKAQVAALARLTADEARGAWLATPVLYSARLDHVRLEDRGLLRVAADESTEWCAEFASQFAPQYCLHAAGPRGFLLSGLDSDGRIDTIDPARMLGADVASALPRGEGAAELKRLGAEIEIWLHGSRLRQRRERAGLAPASALWLWGGGTPAEQPVAAGSGARLAGVALHGADPFVDGLAHFAGHTVAPMQGFAALDSAQQHHVVELAAMSGAHSESLGVLDADWFAAARHALTGGRLPALDVVANDRCFRVAPRAHWRFWRARRGWLENLARRADP